MGDRGNIRIGQGWAGGPDVPDVWLYTHWRGSEIGPTVATALRREQRWDDGSYLARIVFDTLTEGQHGGETGFGITTLLTDNEHPIIRLDPVTRTVSRLDEGSETPDATMAFADFAKLSDDEARRWADPDGYYDD